MVQLQDESGYAMLRDGNVVVYDYKTGHETDTLFRLNDTKLLKLDTIVGFQLSQKGRYMLVYKDKKQLFRRSFVAHYYIYDIQRNELKVLGEGEYVRDPVFSPNSKYIAFGKEDNNLYIHKLDFGTEVAVTTDGKVGKVLNGMSDWLYEEEFGVTYQYGFSSDSKQFAFVRLDETEVPQFTWQTFLSEGYPENHSVKYPRAGETNAKATVVVYDIQYKSLKTMQVNSDYIPRIRWTNDAEQLAIFTLNRNQNRLEMYYANPKSTVTKRVYTEENKTGWVDYEQIDEWQFLKDNSLIVINETDGYRHAYLYTPLGQMKQKLTTEKADVTSVYGYDEQTATLYYQLASTPMTRDICALNVKKQKVAKLAEGVGMHSAVFSANYQYYIDCFQSLTEPNRYTLYSKQKPIRVMLDNEEVKQQFEALNLPRKEFFTFVTERGDTLNGWMLKPVNLSENQQYPVLQVQYSGPASQQVLNRWRPDWEYYLSAEGYVVVCADGRGTGARGRQWREQTYMHIGVMEAQDQVSLARYMQTLPFVKSDRIGIWGWSYGGFMTILSMSQADSPFRCGISVAPVTDFRKYDSAYTERFMRTPQANEQGYLDIALPQMAERLQGRLLLVQGIADDNVHAQNAWLYVDALVRAGKQFDMQFYPDDNHFLRQRSNYEHLYRRKVEFLLTNLKSK